MIWQKLGFKGKATIVVVAGVLLSAALMWYGVRAVNLVFEAERVWSNYNRTATATAQQMNRIHKHLGYGGFIHNFKNYVLRADEKYLERLDADTIEIFAAISEYRSLNISDDERAALARLNAVVDEYVANVEHARIAFAHGEESASVDQTVKVDDTPAILALEMLAEAALMRSRESERQTQAWLGETVSYLSWGLFIIPLVLFSAAVMVRFLWLTLRATETAERAQQEVEGLLKTAPDAMLTVDGRGFIVRANHQAERLFGYTVETLCAMRIEDLMPSRYRSAHVVRRQEYFKAPRPRPMGQDMQLVGLTEDGREVPVEVSLSTMQQDAESYATATVRDITERLEAEQLVRENEERLSLSQAISHVGTWDWNIETGELIWSDEIYSIFDVTPDEFEPSYENYLDFIHPEDKEAVVSDIMSAIEDDVPYEIEHRIITGQKEERVVQGRGEVYLNTNGKPVRMIGVVLDVTERKAFIDALEAAKAEADRANKAKGDFLANMSHEIRTPMNAIMGMGYLALKTDLTRQQGDYLNKMMGSARSLLRIINDILDFSKIEAGKLEMETTPFSLTEVMEDVANVIGAAVDNKRVEVLFATDVDVPCSLIGDPLRLEQVLINLAGNAVKFTESGEVVVRASLEDADEDGNAVLKFTVRDTGIGMSRKQVLNLFQAFHQADTSTTRRFGGTGLGLSISLRLVNMMQGEISVESEEGKGSTFMFTARFGVQPGRKSHRFVPKDMDGTPALIVDDNETARDILSEIMRTFGFHPVAVESGAAALQEIRRAVDADEPYKVILMDWLMDEMDGLETTAKIREDSSLPASPTIIMVTAYGRDMVMERAEQVQLDGFLLKPVTPSVLFDTIMEVLGRDDALGLQDVLAEAKSASHAVLDGAKILVVEDNHINQQVAEEILQDGGADVEIAGDGDQAYRRICVDKEHFDVVLMDLHMPVMDGYVATDLIRETKSQDDLPIIAMTANAMREERQKCLDAGMNDFIAKPIDVDALYAMLVKWIPSERLTSAESSSQQEPETMSGPTQDSPTLPDHLDGFDLVEGLDRMLGRPELYLKFLFKLPDGHDGDAAAVRQALQDGDRDTAHRLAHTVKGVAGNLSATDLYQAATDLDAAIKKGDEDLDGLLDRFDAELARAVQAVRALRGETPADGEGGDAMPTEFDVMTVTGILHEMDAILVKHRMGAGKRVEELRNVLGGHEILKQDFTALEAAIGKLDYVSARDQLSTIASKLGVDMAS